MDVDSGGDGTSLGGGMGHQQQHPENKLGFSQGTCTGSGRPGTRRSGNTDQERLQMGRSKGVGARRSLETCRLKNAGGGG